MVKEKCVQFRHLACTRPSQPCAPPELRNLYRRRVRRALRPALQCSHGYMARMRKRQSVGKASAAFAVQNLSTMRFAGYAFRRSAASLLSAKGACWTLPRPTNAAAGRDSKRNAINFLETKLIEETCASAVSVASWVRVTVRLPVILYRALDDAAHASRLPVAVYLRDVLAGHTPPIAPPLLAQLPTSAIALLQILS